MLPYLLSWTDGEIDREKGRARVMFVQSDPYSLVRASCQLQLKTGSTKQMLLTTHQYNGLCKDFFSQKIRDYNGSGWVGPGLTPILLVESHPKIVLNQC